MAGLSLPHKSSMLLNLPANIIRTRDVWDAAFRFLAEHDLEALSIGNHVASEREMLGYGQ